MKTALITTTINVPKVLALYRKLGPDVRFFVAVDKKTPDEAMDFLHELPNTKICQGDKYKCSELVGWNTDSRRNIALLEAVKWGAEIIVSIDDDMIPMGLDFFERFEIMLSEPYSGLQYGAPRQWCDVGRQTIPMAPQRGLPLGWRCDDDYSFVTDVQIGAMQGIILGTPDTDTHTTMAKCPHVLFASKMLDAGFVIDPLAKSVFNSQFIAFRRELAPCFAQFYKWQARNTDIFASLVMRRVMRERGLRTYFGRPYGFHNRNAHDPIKDLLAEQWGVKHVVEFEQWLDQYVYMSDDKTALDSTRRIYSGMSEHILPRENIDCALTFLEDMESVL
jgi:hypothetical protein